MRLSNRANYAVRAVFDMAFHGDDEPAQVRDIARRQAIPVRFLEQILRDLKRYQLVVAKRGPRGGYSLARTADQIRLGDIVRSVEGPLRLFSADALPNRSHNAEQSLRVISSVFTDLSTRVDACFDAVTVADLCHRAEQLGLRRSGAQRYSYVI